MVSFWSGRLERMVDKGAVCLRGASQHVQDKQWTCMGAAGRTGIAPGSVAAWRTSAGQRGGTGRPRWAMHTRSVVGNKQPLRLMWVAADS